MLVDAILRLFVIAIGFVFAAATTAVALVFTLRGPIAAAGRAAGEAAGAVDDVEAAFEVVLAAMRLFAALIGGFTLSTALVVALCAVAVAEIARIRSWLYHVAGGGVAMGAAAAVQGFDLKLIDLALSGVAVSLVAAGFAGGAVYWLLAGRRAGF